MISPRARYVGVALLAAGVLLASALSAGGVLAVRGSGGPLGIASLPQSQLEVVRVPGNLEIARLDRTVRDNAIIAALADEVWSLPRYPTDERCPASFGTSYTVAFATGGLPRWTATIGVQGCEVVEIEGRPAQWAAHSPQLWTDLAVALGLTLGEVQPVVCFGPEADPGCSSVVTRGQP